MFKEPKPKANTDSISNIKYKVKQGVIKKNINN